MEDTTFLHGILTFFCPSQLRRNWRAIPPSLSSGRGTLEAGARRPGSGNERQFSAKCHMTSLANVGIDRHTSSVAGWEFV
jgi:hypothetical protein